MRDALTGVLNRRSLDERLEEVVGRARRSKLPSTLVLVDLDDFKAINDTLGHAGGDDLLRRVGDLLRRRTRVGDLAFRLGGDEFCLLLPETGASEGAEVVRRSLAGLPPTLGDAAGRSVPISFSAGCAEIGQGKGTGDDALRRADGLLYLAKGQGRGCVMVEGDHRPRFATIDSAEAVPALPRDSKTPLHLM